MDLVKHRQNEMYISYNKTYSISRYWTPAILKQQYVFSTSIEYIKIKKYVRNDYFLL